MDMFDILNQSINSQNPAAEKAVEKIKSEMDKDKDNTYVQVVGEYLLQRLSIEPELADKILNKNKTILKSLDAMKAVASKKKTGNFAMLTPQEGYDVVIKYFSKELDIDKNKPGKQDNKTSEPEGASEAESDIETDDEE